MLPKLFEACLETLVGKGNKRAKGVLKQLEEPEKSLSTIQIGITLIDIVSGAYGGATMLSPFMIALTKESDGYLEL